MVSRKEMQSEIKNINIIDMILLDHRSIKECIEVLLSDATTKTRKLEVAKVFFEFMIKHIATEEKIVYSQLLSDEKFHFNVLEFKVEHGMVSQKIKDLRSKVMRARILKEEVEAELKVLSQVVKTHIKEEESDFLPKMQELLDEATLVEMGDRFMKLRKLSPKDLRDHPHLQDELVMWKDDVQKVSSKFLSMVDKTMENLRH
jgi:hemerythrin-like domain-containing protein